MPVRLVALVEGAFGKIEVIWMYLEVVFVEWCGNLDTRIISMAV